MHWLSPEEVEIVLLSLKVAAVAMLWAVPIAVLVGWWLARTRLPLKAVISALVYLPLVLPPVVTGYGLLILFGRTGPAGRLLEWLFGEGIAFRWTGAALAAAIMAFPLLVRPIRQAFEAVDPGLEAAADTLGAHPVMVFATVSLPLALPGLISGAILGFAKALGEFGATITFVSNIPGETQTLSLAVYALLQSPTGDAAALRLILASVLLSIAAVLISEWIFHRRANPAAP